MVKFISMNITSGLSTTIFESVHMIQVFDIKWKLILVQLVRYSRSTDIFIMIQAKAKHGSELKSNQ